MYACFGTTKALSKLIIWQFSGNREGQWLCFSQ